MIRLLRCDTTFELKPFRWFRDRHPVYNFINI